VRWPRLKLSRRTLWLILAVELLVAGSLHIANRRRDSAPPVDINVTNCAVVTERQNLDIRGLRVPDGADRAMIITLLNAYWRDSRTSDAGDEWVLHGRIDKTAAQALRERLSQPNPPHALRITSNGGHEHAAIDMAELIATHRLPVIVDGVCGSACASYLLPAAPRVRLEGIVLMHGSAASCQQRLGLWRGLRELGLASFLELRRASQRQHDFEQRHPRFKALVERSAPADRGDPSGAPHIWRHVPPAELVAAHPGLSIGTGHARAEATYRLLQQAWPEFSDAYFPP
jgi:hypothetical protein